MREWKVRPRNIFIFEDRFDYESFGDSEKIMVDEFSEPSRNCIYHFVPTSPISSTGTNLQNKVIKKFGRIIQICNPITYYSEGI